jgi:SAM-dependent MidA family methyltransferase
MSPPITGHPELIQAIRDQIAWSPRQAISFRAYMELCLYHESYGYYISGKHKIGKDGDFYTSSFIGEIMGEMIGKWIARQCESMSGDEELIIAEWGAGTGRMAVQLLSYIQNHHPDLYLRTKYMIVEASPYHRQWIQQALAEHLEQVQLCTEKECLFELSHKRRSFVLANELLDAFPVHRVVRQQGEVYEIYISWDEEAKRFTETLEPAADELTGYLGEQTVELVEGQVAEINLDALSWIRNIGSAMKDGTVILIDYGHLADELYARHRMRGTLMCYRKHQAHDDPYVYVGEQDITAHVDFSACQRAAEEAGFLRQVYSTQTEFLVEAGIMEELQAHDGRDPFSAASKRNRSIRQLLISDQMGDTFKVLLLHK